MRLNSIIKAIKPIKMMVLNLNAHWISWISTILFMADDFVMKMNINDVLWQKNITYLATCQRSINVHQSDRAPNAECEKPQHNKTKAPRLSKLDPQAYDILGTMFYKWIINRRKSCFDFNEITALSLCRRFNMYVQFHFFNFIWEPS